MAVDLGEVEVAVEVEVEVVELLVTPYFPYPGDYVSPRLGAAEPNQSIFRFTNTPRPTQHFTLKEDSPAYWPYGFCGKARAPAARAKRKTCCILMMVEMLDEYYLAAGEERSAELVDGVLDFAGDLGSIYVRL